MTTPRTGQRPLDLPTRSISPTVDSIPAPNSSEINDPDLRHHQQRLMRAQELEAVEADEPEVADHHAGEEFAQHARLPELLGHRARELAGQENDGERQEGAGNGTMSIASRGQQGKAVKASTTLTSRTSGSRRRFMPRDRSRLAGRLRLRAAPPRYRPGPRRSSRCREAAAPSSRPRGIRAGRQGRGPPRPSSPG